MREIIKYRSSFITLLFIVSCLVFFTKCINNEKDKKAGAAATAYNEYAGAASCNNCHKSICETHSSTAHFHTSEIAAEKNIKGSFDTRKNTFAYDAAQMIAMEKKADSFYQVAYINGVEQR